MIKLILMGRKKINKRQTRCDVNLHLPKILSSTSIFSDSELDILYLFSSTVRVFDIVKDSEK